MKVKHAKILITGASRGIGKALAEHFASYQCELVLLNRQASLELEDRLRSLGASKVRTYTVNFENATSIHDFIRNWKSESFDILINNAGVLTGGPLLKQTPDEISRVFLVNVTNLILLTQGLLPILLQQKTGKIVNNSSISSEVYFPYASTYAASKAAVRAFSLALSAELKGTGVSVLCLETPGVQTEMYNDISRKYGEHMTLDHLTAIPASQYAATVHRAIESDQVLLTPKGWAHLLLVFFRLFPSKAIEITAKSKKQKGVSP